MASAEYSEGLAWGAKFDSDAVTVVGVVAFEAELQWL